MEEQRIRDSKKVVITDVIEWKISDHQIGVESRTKKSEGAYHENEECRKTYKQEVMVQERMIKRHECTCPYGGTHKDELCKHVCALILLICEHDWKDPNDEWTPQGDDDDDDEEEEEEEGEGDDDTEIIEVSSERKYDAEAVIKEWARKNL